MTEFLQISSRCDQYQKPVMMHAFADTIDTIFQEAYTMVVSDLRYHHKIDLCVTSHNLDGGVNLFGSTLDYWIIGKPL